jgi:zinc/manganese transport system substrate-binding protein
MRQVKVRMLRAATLLTCVLALFAACGTTQATAPGGGKIIQVVAGENFWGSIATQLGGTHVSVTSIVSDPNADPHQYESNASDARAFAGANYVILNGAGYDDWGQKLLDANPVDGRKVITVADVLGKHEGDNPHFWYNPDDVEQMANQITSDYKGIDPASSAYFDQQRQAFETALGSYHMRLQAIKTKFAGQKIGATESIFTYMANYLGLDLISPPDFMQAVSEGNDPPADAVVTFEQQIQQKQMAVLVYNSQTITPVTDHMKQLAAQAGIPLVAVSETIQPANMSFQDWQTAQLLQLQNALSAQA